MASKSWRKFCAFALRKLGWTVGEPVAPDPKAIILGVPHTSIWDFVISYLYYTSVGGNIKVMIKASAFFWPLGPILRKLGGVPMDRSNPTRIMVSTIHAMNDAETFHLALSPEGTRKAVSRWKTGFHVIARKTGASVYLGYFDWGRKRVGRGQKFEISDDAQADIAKIQAIYEEMDLSGLHDGCYLTK